MSERNAMHALAAGRIVGEVIKRVREGDHPTAPAFTNEILEDALIEVHRLFTAEQDANAALVAAGDAMAAELADYHGACHDCHGSGKEMTWDVNGGPPERDCQSCKPGTKAIAAWRAAKVQQT